jgi:AcrR family transcriptional regulator
VAASERVGLRRIRERELVLATRALFDERGVQEAPIEEIARAVGIARGLVYREFASKDELYVLTVTTYLDEIATMLGDVVATAGDDPTAQLGQGIEAFAHYCRRYPAFLDCALSLMRRPARELQASVSESVWLRLGQGMARCISLPAAVLRAGREQGQFIVDDADVMANVLWTQTLGAMHLARIRVGLRQDARGVPALFVLEPDTVVRTCVESALATAGVGRAV